MVEVICVATLRQLPAVHPIYKVNNCTSYKLRDLPSGINKVILFLNLEVKLFITVD